MTLKQLIKLENKSKEVWVVSPTLHYDIENKDFTELVSINLGQKTKYRYIVPATSQVEKNLTQYKQIYGVSEEDIQKNFLLLPPSDFNPFIMEIAIYDATGECVACSAPATEDSSDVIRFNTDTSLELAKQFRNLWKKYKRVAP